MRSSFPLALPGNPPSAARSPEILAEGNQEFIVNCLSPIDLHPERRGVRMARRPVDNG
jgi:hypothetical protein